MTRPLKGIRSKIRLMAVLAPFVVLSASATAEAQPRLPVQAAPAAQAAVSRTPPRRIAAPEFNGKATGAAVALLLGGVLVVTDRLRRKPSA